jgi:hypothetical protein
MIGSGLIWAWECGIETRWCEWKCQNPMRKF